MFCNKWGHYIVKFYLYHIGCYVEKGVFLVGGVWVPLCRENQIHLTGKLRELQVHFLRLTTWGSCLLKPFTRAYLIWRCCEMFYGRCENLWLLNPRPLPFQYNKLKASFSLFFWCVCWLAFLHADTTFLSLRQKYLHGECPRLKVPSTCWWLLGKLQECWVFYVDILVSYCCWNK